MRIYDVSLPISEQLVTWPGDPRPELEQVATLHAQGINLTRLTCNAHVGTHVDAPDHLIVGGATVEALPLEVLIGPAYVIALPGVRQITSASLDVLDWPADAQRVLFKTDNSHLWCGSEAGEFQPDFVALAPDAAHWLVERDVRLAGVDYLSVDPYETQGAEPYPAHRILLGAGVVIVEGLNLAGVPPGAYELLCLPLKLVGADGAPARVILRG